MKKIPIERSESFNHYENNSPEKAYDGDLDTYYTVRNYAMAGNFLKLYLSQAHSIAEVKMISRNAPWYVERLMNTEVRVYSTDDGEIEIASCGKITGIDFERSKLI